MPTTTRSPCAFAQGGMESPVFGERKGSDEKSRSRRPRATRCPLRAGREGRHLEVVVEDPPAARSGVVAAREERTVAVVAHAPDEGGPDVDAFRGQELQEVRGRGGEGSQPRLWRWGSLATKRAGA